MEPKNLLNSIFLNLIEGNKEEATSTFAKYFRAKSQPMIGEGFHDEEPDSYDRHDYDQEEFNETEDFSEMLAFTIGEYSCKVKAYGKQKVYVDFQSGGMYEPPSSEITKYGPIVGMSLESFDINGTVTEEFSEYFEDTDSEILHQSEDVIARQLHETAVWMVNEKKGDLSGDLIKFTDAQFCLAFMKGLNLELGKRIDY